jgi:hypothetical protein
MERATFVCILVDCLSAKKICWLEWSLIVDKPRKGRVLVIFKNGIWGQVCIDGLLGI